MRKIKLFSRNHHLPFLLLIAVFLFSLKHGITQNKRLWATYYGGNSHDGGGNIITDASGNIYMCEQSSSLGMASGAFQNTYAGSEDALLVKFDANGNRIWARYFGGPDFDTPRSLAIDTFGNIYMTGQTNSSTGISFGGFQNTYSGYEDIYLVKFDANGNRIWATYYGEMGTEIGLCVTTDIHGNVYITGNTGSYSGIAFGGFQNSYGGGLYDAFLVKFDSNGNRIWATYYGGSGRDVGASVVTDGLGNIYLGGYTDSPSGIASGGFQNNYGGGQNDAFLVKFDINGNRIWATYYGAAALDVISSISVNKGNIYAGGATSSSSGIAFGGFQNTFGGIWDALLVKFDTSGNRIWATYYGGTEWEEGISIALDHSDNIYLGGVTESSSGIASGGFKNTFGPSRDCFVTKFDSSGNRLCATYYGGLDTIHSSGDDGGSHVSTDIFNNVYLAGTTFNTSNIASGGFQNVFGGGSIAMEDGFLVKLSSCCPLPIATISGVSTLCSGESTTLTANGGSTYIWSTGSSLASISVTPTTTSIYSVIASNSCGKDTAITIININPAPIAIISPNTTICSGTSTTLYVSGGTNYIWSNGMSNSSIQVNPSTSTHYSVTVSIGSCTDTASTIITVNPSPIALISGNTSICSGQITTLIASGGGIYLWNSGTTNNTISVSPTSTISYSVAVTSGNGCMDTASATVTVTPTPLAAISPNSTICSGSNTSVLASGGENYLWNTGQTTNLILVSPPLNMTYIVTVSNGNCKDTASTTVTVNPNPIAGTSGNITIYQGQVTTLIATGGATYLWSNGETTSSILIAPVINTKYCVTVTDTNNCADIACATVSIESPCDTAGAFFIPNVFSPNGDGDNDQLKIYFTNLECIQSLHLIIYDRWGEIVYETFDKNFLWDGKYFGKLSANDVFAYYLIVKFQDNKLLQRKGNVSMMK